MTGVVSNRVVRQTSPPGLEEENCRNQLVQRLERRKTPRDSYISKSSLSLTFVFATVTYFLSLVMARRNGALNAGSSKQGNIFRA